MLSTAALVGSEEILRYAQDDILREIAASGKALLAMTERGLGLSF